MRQPHAGPTPFGTRGEGGTERRPRERLRLGRGANPRRLTPDAPRPSQVQAQIGQMVEFIRKEAQEKASEIKAAAEEEYAIEKQHMTEAEISRIRNEFESKLSSMEIKKKIEVRRGREAAAPSPRRRAARD